MSRLVAIFFGVGLLRPAPGTWGSAAAIGLGLILHRIGHFPLLLAATLI
ncbi:MAG: phosphatidylglycerophosphatase A, partial [Pseudorhodobacter sp.]